MSALIPSAEPPKALVAACRARAALIARIEDADEQPFPGEIPVPSPELDGLRQRLAEIDREIAEAVCTWLLKASGAGE